MVQHQAQEGCGARLPNIVGGGAAGVWKKKHDMRSRHRKLRLIMFLLPILLLGLVCCWTFYIFFNEKPGFPHRTPGQNIDPGIPGLDYGENNNATQDAHYGDYNTTHYPSNTTRDSDDRHLAVITALPLITSSDVDTDEEKETTNRTPSTIPTPECGTIKLNIHTPHAVERNATVEETDYSELGRSTTPEHVSKSPTRTRRKKSGSRPKSKGSDDQKKKKDDDHLMEGIDLSKEDSVLHEH